MITQAIISRVIPRIVPFSLKIKNAVVANNSKQYLGVHQCFNYNPTSNMVIPRLYGTEIDPADITVDYDYVKKATSSQDVLIIDVREPEEIKEHGKIPNSINIPLGNVTTVLSTMSEKEFKHTYNRPKPSEDTEIIFYCMIGKRSGMAQQNAINLGYKKGKNYLGSWTEWATKEK